MVSRLLRGEGLGGPKVTAVLGEKSIAGEGRESSYRSAGHLPTWWNESHSSFQTNKFSSTAIMDDHRPYEVCASSGQSSGAFSAASYYVCSATEGIDSKVPPRAL